MWQSNPDGSHAEANSQILACSKVVLGSCFYQPCTRLEVGVPSHERQALLTLSEYEPAWCACCHAAPQLKGQKGVEYCCASS